MINRIYIAPFSFSAPASALADAIAEHIPYAARYSVFATEPELWFSDPETAQAHSVQRLESGPVIIDGTLPRLPIGTDALDCHVMAAPHLQAGVIGVINATGLPASDLECAATIAARRFHHAHTPLIGIMAVDAEQTPTETVVPVIATTRENLAHDVKPLLDTDVNVPISALAYQTGLIRQAHEDPRTIVLPEADDDRILHAAARLQEMDAVNLILLGVPDQVHAHAKDLGISLDGIDIIDPHDEERRDRYAKELAKLREKKGMTYEKALEQVRDLSYFGTMMIHMGEADGMVSGAAHTTAETIRPALQIIKTKPGISTVSGAFLMLFADHASLFADCAVTIDPSAEQLADIATVSSHTASAFGIDPKVALISYSTGTSGTGPTVDKVAQATELVHQAHPEIAVDGPLQFDAAIDQDVAAKKRPDSAVAGNASVFVFNHLDVGNCTYKAVQRTSGATAVGPILQGLKKPVNDLSRGALVEDIVNTVIITAIQAQND